MRLYTYKLTTDVGQAPCVQDDLLTLAICKPMIRTTARVGDLIFGFAANHIMDPIGHATDNHLIYIARVDEVIGRDYYDAEEFVGRMDCAYEPAGGGFRWRAGRCHGPEHLAHDLGVAPAYSRAVVLASRDFRYFGSTGTSEYKSQFPAVKDAVESLGRGHRVCHDAAVRRELIELRDLVWETTGACVVGNPDAQASAPSATGSCRRPAVRRPGCGAK